MPLTGDVRCGKSKLTDLFGFFFTSQVEEPSGLLLVS